MTRTFIFGFIIGLFGAAASVYFVPAVDLHREISLISVQPNGGNREVFHINLPQDRILAGQRTGAQSSSFPSAVKWPDENSLDGFSSEAFKLRNADDVVVGVATRISSSREMSGPFIQWMIHLPARGTMFVDMHTGLTEDGFRGGLLMAGTREFKLLTGEVQEYFNTDAKDAEFGISGRIELISVLAGTLSSNP